MDNPWKLPARQAEVLSLLVFYKLNEAFHRFLLEKNWLGLMIPDLQGHGAMPLQYSVHERVV